MSNCLGRNVKTLRAYRGISQAELAEKAGLSFATIKGVENGWHAPAFETVSKLAAFFNVSLDLLSAKDIKFKC